jgi:DNA-binding GntR family transcriptional regulator
MRKALRTPAPAVVPDTDPTTVNEAVYTSLKTQIMSNELPPGFKLAHQALAELLGVSRTPVREALERLYQEGFVLRILNRGYYVVEIDAREASELYDLREALELHVVRGITRQGLTRAQLAGLERMHRRYESLIGRELSRERLLVDRDFHLRLAELGGNRQLVRSLAGIFERLILKRRVDGYHDTGTQPFEEHLRLLAALRERDHARAAAAISAHIECARTRLLHHLATVTAAPQELPIKRLRDKVQTSS